MLFNETHLFYDPLYIDVLQYRYAKVPVKLTTTDSKKVQLVCQLKCLSSQPLFDLLLINYVKLKFEFEISFRKHLL